MSKGTSLYTNTETGDLVRKFAAQAGVGTGAFLASLVRWYGYDTANTLIEFRAVNLPKKRLARVLELVEDADASKQK
jgi:hypothetical protein